jgi:hypothetical protein
VYQFSEFHSIPIAASKDRVYAAIRKVTPEEILFFKTLTWMRRFGKPSPAGVLNAPERRPILETFTVGAFLVLADDPGREIVFGRAGNPRRGGALPAEEFKAAHQGEFVKIAMNFRIEEMDATHCPLTTETRVYAAGPQVVRGFAAYWRMIYPGSALIRRMWLRAIKLRAEAASESDPASEAGTKRPAAAVAHPFAWRAPKLSTKLPILSSSGSGAGAGEGRCGVPALAQTHFTSSVLVPGASVAAPT